MTAPHAAVHVSRHPLLLHKLSLLRSTATGAREFRAMVRDLTQLLLYEALQDVTLAPLTVQTPLAACEGLQFAERIGLVPILRAGIGWCHRGAADQPHRQLALEGQHR